MKRFSISFEEESGLGTLKNFDHINVPLHIQAPLHVNRNSSPNIDSNKPMSEEHLGMCLRNIMIDIRLMEFTESCINRGCIEEIRIGDWRYYQPIASEQPHVDDTLFSIELNFNHDGFLFKKFVFKRDNGLGWYHSGYLMKGR